jgi:hypothetical protein
MHYIQEYFAFPTNDGRTRTRIHQTRRCAHQRYFILVRSLICFFLVRGVGRTYFCPVEREIEREKLEEERQPGDVVRSSQAKHVVRQRERGRPNAHVSPMHDTV